jgi:hypothetical protein
MAISAEEMAERFINRLTRELAELDAQCTL